MSFKHRLSTLLAALALPLGLGSCTLVETLNVLIPTSDLDRVAHVQYGTLPRQKLDIYRPADNPTRARPVVVFFYGGSWDSGRKEEYLFVAEALTSIGVVAVLPDYRVYPEVKFPDFLADAAAAVSWTQANIAGYGGDPRHVFVMGHSAGAHIAAMLTYDRQWLRNAGSDPARLAGFIGLAGPYDFLPLKSERLKMIFESDDARAKAQPIHFVTRDAPPALLLHGDSDTIVGPHNSIHLARRIQERGGRVEHVRYPGLDHRTIVVNLAAMFRAGKPELPAIAGFIRRQTTLAGDRDSAPPSQTAHPAAPDQATGATP